MLWKLPVQRGSTRPESPRLSGNYIPSPVQEQTSGCIISNRSPQRWWKPRIKWGPPPEEDDVPLCTCLGRAAVPIPQNVSNEPGRLRPGDTGRAAVHVTLQQTTNPRRAQGCRRLLPGAHRAPGGPVPRVLRAHQPVCRDHRGTCLSHALYPAPQEIKSGQGRAATHD